MHLAKYCSCFRPLQPSNLVFHSWFSDYVEPVSGGGLANGGRLFFFKVKSLLGELPKAFLSMTQCSEQGSSCDLQPQAEAGLN